MQNAPNCRIIINICLLTRRDKKWMNWKSHPNYGFKPCTWMENNEILNLKTTLKRNFCNHSTHPHCPMVTKIGGMSYVFGKPSSSVFSKNIQHVPLLWWSKSFSHHNKGQLKIYGHWKLFAHIATIENFLLLQGCCKNF